jgi:hypothetical protein
MVSFGLHLKTCSNTLTVLIFVKYNPVGTKSESAEFCLRYHPSSIKDALCSPFWNQQKLNLLCFKKAKEIPREVKDPNWTCVLLFFELQVMAVVHNWVKLLNTVKGRFVDLWDVMQCWNQDVIWLSVWPLIIGTQVRD